MSDLNEKIGYQVQGTADWRRQKAEQFPDDERNLEAAEELDRLAAEIDALEDSEIHRQINEAWENIDRLPEDGPSNWVRHPGGDFRRTPLDRVSQQLQHRRRIS